MITLDLNKFTDDVLAEYIVQRQEYKNPRTLIVNSATRCYLRAYAQPPRYMIYDDSETYIGFIIEADNTLADGEFKLL